MADSILYPLERSKFFEIATDGREDYVLYKTSMRIKYKHDLYHAKIYKIGVVLQLPYGEIQFFNNNCKNFFIEPDRSARREVEVHKRGFLVKTDKNGKITYDFYTPDGKRLFYGDNKNSVLNKVREHNDMCERLEENDEAFRLYRGEWEI